MTHCLKPSQSVLPDGVAKVTEGTGPPAKNIPDHELCVSNSGRKRVPARRSSDGKIFTVDGGVIDLAALGNHQPSMNTV